LGCRPPRRRVPGRGRGGRAQRPRRPRHGQRDGRPAVTHPLRDRAAIAGIGATEFSKESGRTELRLACEAVAAALADAGLEPAEVDGMVTFSMDGTDDTEIARATGIGDLSFFSRVPYGGGAACGTVAHAAMAIAAGVAEVVVCYRALNGRSWSRFGAGVQGLPAAPTADRVHFGW